MRAPSRLFSWLLQKLVLALLLVALGLAGVALALFLRDPRDFDLLRTERERTLVKEKTALRAAGIEADRRMAATRVQLSAQHDRAKQAERVARELEGLSGGLNRLTTSSAQLREYEERRDRMRQMAADSRQKAAGLDQALVRIQWEKDGQEIALQRKEQELAAIDADRSAGWHYLREAWTSCGRLLLAAVALVMIGLMFLPRRKR